MDERPITFVNRNGCRLFGMLYSPDRRASPRIGIIISVNAIKYRVGTFRLHVLLARRLCSLGYHVLSFDPEGIGDSEGEFEHKLLSEHYYDIQTGKYSRDLADAIRYFTQSCSIESVVMLGLCGGAISVLMEGGDDPRVSGLILLNIPVLVEDRSRHGEHDHAAKITSSESARSVLNQKLARLLEKDFWWRLIRLQVDVREEARLVRRAASVFLAKVWARAPGARGSEDAVLAHGEPVSKHALFNMRFQTGFARSTAARKHILFVFAEHDPWTWIFKSEFQDAVLAPGHPYEKYVTYELIRSANHIFSGNDSQRLLEQRIVDWLSARYPVHGDEPRAVLLAS
jgi:pimeloyl-ACP methyl ester carboxylesterase